MFSTLRLTCGSLCPWISYGFIACEDTQELYGRDVFVHGKEFGDGEVRAKEGTAILLREHVRCGKRVWV